MLQLDLIKKHYWPKNCSQQYEIKIVNSKKYDEQLNLTRFCIKSKLFEITNEFKEFKFHQNLWIEFTRNDETFKNKIFADPWFDSEKLEFSNINIDELLDIQHDQLSSRFERWTFKNQARLLIK